MQISVVPAESSAGGKEIHQNSWLPPVDSGAFSCKRNNRFFQLHFSASSAARIAALGIPGIEWTEAPPRVSPWETKFYPSSSSLRSHAFGDAISLDVRFSSLSLHGEAQRVRCIYSCFVASPSSCFKARYHGGGP